MLDKCSKIKTSDNKSGVFLLKLQNLSRISVDNKIYRLIISQDYICEG